MKRFLAFVLLVALFLLGLWLNQRRQRGEAMSENFTTSGAPIDAKDVPVLSAMDAEYTRLVQAVVPSVVSLVTTRTIHVPVADPFDLLLGLRSSTHELLKKQNTLIGRIIKVVFSCGTILNDSQLLLSIFIIAPSLSK